MLKTPEFWVAVSFFGFVALLLKYKVPSLIGKALDQRARAEHINYSTIDLRYGNRPVLQ